MQRGFGRFGLISLIAAILAVTSAMGCASARDPIDRVQANAIPKSFFIGEKLNDASDDPVFYARTMIIDVPFGESGGTSSLFTNGQNVASKIKWDVEEDQLVGRVAFERILGTDGKGTTPTPPTSITSPVVDRTKPLAQNDGIVVYSFKIESQFDIRRSYNPTTGEENNIIEENTTDRPWYEREYIRVDFSSNLVTTAYDFDFLALLNLFDARKYTPMAFDIRNPNDVNAPVYDIKNGYLDVTNKVFAEPGTINFGSISIPACYLPNVVSGGSSPIGNCNPNEITLRHSFKRVVDTDYEPTNWDGQRFETYGAFFSERNGYAKDYGLVDADLKRYINRYNIWERSHVYADPDKMTGPVACKVDADCLSASDIQGMSHCDELHQKCSLPYQSRKQKPIIWHYSDGSAPEYFDATRDATEDWDTAMRVAVQVAKYAECQRFGNLDADGTACNVTFPGVIDGNFADEEDAIYLVKEVNACRRTAYVAGKADPVAECTQLADELGAQRGYAAPVIAIAKLPSMVTLCHSPVDKTDPTTCGAVGTVARLGDLRYHLVSAIAVPQTGSPWGIMTDANDPETGEHIAASINIWTNPTETISRNLVDIARYIGGELQTADITDGTYVDQWVEAARLSGGAGASPILGQAEVDKRVAAIGGVSVDQLHAVEAKAAARRPMKGTALASGLLPVESALIANLRKVQTSQASLTATSSWAPVYEARKNQLRGTAGEAAIVTPAMQQLATAAIGDVATTSSTATGAASALRGLDPTTGKDLYRKLQAAIAQRGGCMMESNEAVAPLGYAAFTDVLQAKFGTFNAGDDVGTQTARADRMKDYVRRRLHASVISHEMGHSFGERHNFVSSSDPWNYRPQYWALRTNGKTVTTACPADASAASDGSACIGPRWLDKITDNEHGNLIEMFAASSTMEYPGEPTQDMLGLGVYDFAAARLFYGDAATVYTDARFAASRSAGSIAAGHQNDFGGLLGFRFGDFAAPTHYSQLDSAVSLIEACATVDATKWKPFNWDDTANGTWSPLLDGRIVTNSSGKPIRCTQPKVDFVQWDTLKSTTAKTHTVDQKNRVRVPHSFASDEWADLGNVAVYRNDNGGDVYEQMAYWQAKQEMNHIFADYRRGRADFSIWAAFNRSLTRNLESMRDNAKAIALYATISRDTVTEYFSGDDTSGDNPQAYVASILKQIAPDSAVASSIAFDHFTHVFSRPQPGAHGPLGTEDPGNGTTIARSYDSTGFASTTGIPSLLKVANGVTGGYGSISLGGRPIENALATNQGRDFNQKYTLNVGSYYEKAYTGYLLTESADNFISARRDDFVDPRYRAVSLADVFPDGFRRWLANNLTDDEQIKGNLVLTASGTAGAPLLDTDGYARLAQTSWWPSEGIEACFPQGDRLFCHDPFSAGTAAAPGGTVVDPQVGFEQQKFALIMTLIYLPENARTNWLDMIRVYDVSADADPGFDNRIEFHSPDGKTYAAQTFGTEVLYGKTVQKGIGARVLEWANFLMSKGVITQPVMRNGIQVGLAPKLTATGQVQYVNGTTPVTTCAQSGWCSRMQDYTEIPKLMHDLEVQLGVDRFGGWLRGVY